jgi:hypothetical protein
LSYIKTISCDGGHLELQIDSKHIFLNVHPKKFKLSLLSVDLVVSETGQSFKIEHNGENVLILFFSDTTESTESKLNLNFFGWPFKKMCFESI